MLQFVIFESLKILNMPLLQHVRVKTFFNVVLKFKKWANKIKQNCLRILKISAKLLVTTYFGSKSFLKLSLQI